MIFKTIAEQGQAITADHERHRQSKQAIKNRHFPTSIRPEIDAGGARSAVKHSLSNSGKTRMNGTTRLPQPTGEAESNLPIPGAFPERIAPTDEFFRRIPATETRNLRVFQIA